MTLRISVHFACHLNQMSDALLQFEAANTHCQRRIETSARIAPMEHFSRVPAEDAIGERIWLRAQGRIDVHYDARIAIERSDPPLDALEAIPLHRLPSEAVKYLFESRYCQPTQFIDFCEGQFGHLRGGEQVTAIRDWVAGNVAYSSGASGPATSAIDTFHDRQGICRDFAHLFVTLARASNVPARYVACYAPGVSPQDFHAIAQVYLAESAGHDASKQQGGSWHCVDPTGMADPQHTAIIGVGRDAADVSFLTTFGPMQFIESKVAVQLEGQGSVFNASPEAGQHEAVRS